MENSTPVYVNRESRRFNYKQVPRQVKERFGITWQVYNAQFEKQQPIVNK